MTDADLKELIQEFLIECEENLNRLDTEMLALERDPGHQPTLASIFRTIHTVKGSAGLIGLPKMEALTHAGESLLSLLRDGHLRLDVELTSAILALVDAIRAMLFSLGTDGTEGSGDYEPLRERLLALQQKQQAPLSPAAPAAPAAPPADAAANAPSASTAAPHEAAQPRAHVSAATANAVHAAATAAAAAATAVLAAPTGDEHAAGEGRPGPADNNIRVDVGLLDRLMNLVGELVLARNQVMQFTVTHDFAALGNTFQRLDLITTELQETAMKTRMQPIGNAWSKLPRVVRDLALSCGKQVRVELEGKETELDKTLVEAIKDPLLHAVRNAVDHGIEAPDVRAAAGKTAEGRLLLRAYHEGGQVNIEISDDGGGIDLERVRAKAIERNLLDPAAAARLGDRETLQLIFLPGFSTAAKVTSVSGRGVGMDVVKTNIERIGGTIDIASERGHGTTLRIRIPLTLAIVPALIVRASGDRFAIPQVNLLELLRLEGEDLRRVEHVHGAPVYRLRGELLPLLDLAEQLGIEPRRDSDAVNIVVVQAEARRFGLLVDDIEDTQEIVVKPIGRLLKNLPVFAGATIMGDGQVALILDVVGVANRAAFTARDSALLGDDAAARSGGGTLQRLLLLGCADGSRVAIPLDHVARLEELPAGSVEQSGGDEVVQYRGGILPLVWLSTVLSREPSPRAEGASLPVVVCGTSERTLGLVVDQVLDIIEDTLSLQRRSHGDTLLGTAVISGRVTDILDAERLLEQHASERTVEAAA